MFSKFIITALAFSSLLVNASPTKQQYPNTCDNDKSGTLQWSPNKAPVMHYADDLVKMAAPGTGACSVPYRLTSHVACMKAGW